MNRFMGRCVAGCVAALLAVSPAIAENEAPGAFALVKSLEGEWLGPDDDQDGEPDYTMVYELTSAGNVMRVRQFPGTAHEMTNMIHPDGDSLVMTHYCAIGNQPRMRADAKAGDATLHFRFDSVTNKADDDQVYMGQAVITVRDANTLHEEWTSFKDGEEVNTMVFEMKRKQPNRGAPDVENMPFQRYYVLIYRHGPNHKMEQTPELMELQTGHLNHIRDLRDAGKLVMGGPFEDQTGGLLIIKAESAAEVEAWGAEDPAVRAGHLTARVHPWMVPASDDW